MAYIGNTSLTTNVQPATDFFSGNGSTVSFTLSRTVVSAFTIEAVINNVQQNPFSAYTVSGNTITFTSAPPSGTNNIYIRYNSIQGQTVGIGQGTVGTAQLGAVSNINSVVGNMTLQTNGNTALTLNASSGIVSTTGIMNVGTNLGVGTVSPAYSIDAGSRTDAILLPKGTTAQRPTGTTSTGALRYSTTNNQPEVWNGNLWASVIIANADGSSPSAAAVSAQAIKNITGTTTSGYYYITLGGTARQVWCDMSGATAWMLAMRCENNGNTFRFQSAYWTDNNNLNETSDPTANVPMKNNFLWQNYTITNIRLTGSQTTTAYNANPLIFSGFSTTLNGIFNSGNNIYDANIALGRTAWLNWFTAVTGVSASVFDNQPNCNVDQINANYTYAGARIGIVFNNENDCSSDDAAAGFGTYGNSNINEGVGAGGTQWNPTNNYRAHGWLWVN